MTRKEFKKRSALAFIKANPEAKLVTIDWVDAPKYVTYPTGVKGWLGRFKATAPGYRSRIILAEASDDGLIVR